MPHAPCPHPQVLRPLAEVALWGELPVLQQLWSSFVPLVDSLPCWVSASTLLLVLQRTSGFQQLLSLHTSAAHPSPPLSPAAAPPPRLPPPPPAPATQPAHPPAHPSAHAAGALHPATIEALRSIVEHVCALLPQLLPSVALLVDHASSDKVSVLAAQLVSMAHARFGRQLPLLARQQPMHFASLHRLLTSLFRDAHPPPHVDIAVHDAHAPADGPERAVPDDAANGGGGAESHTPTDTARYLLPAAASENLPPPARTVEHARLVERSLVTALKAELPALAATLSLRQRALLLRWLLPQLRLPQPQQTAPSLLDAVDACLQPPVPPPPAAAEAAHPDDGPAQPVSATAASVGSGGGAVGGGSSSRRLFVDPPALRPPATARPAALPPAPPPPSPPHPPPPERLGVAACVPGTAAAVSAGISDNRLPHCAEVLLTMAHVLAGGTITMATLKQALAICRLAISGGVCDSAPDEAIAFLVQGLSDCLRGHGTPSPLNMERLAAGGTLDELRRMLDERAAARREPPAPEPRGLGSTASRSNGSDGSAGMGSGSEGGEMATAAAEEGAAIDGGEAAAEPEDSESDWDDWDDDDEEEEIVEAGPRYVDVGSLLWWLAEQPDEPDQPRSAALAPMHGLRRRQLEAAVGRLHDADATLLLAAMRHAGTMAAKPDAEGAA